MAPHVWQAHLLKHSLHGPLPAAFSCGDHTKDTAMLVRKLSQHSAAQPSSRLFSVRLSAAPRRCDAVPLGRVRGITGKVCAADRT